MRTNNVSEDAQGLLIVVFTFRVLTELLEEGSNVVVAIGYSMAFVTFESSHDLIGLRKASKTLVQLTLLIIVDRDHEIRVADLHALALVELFSVLDIFAVNQLALSLITQAVVEACYHAKRAQHPLEVPDLHILLDIFANFFWCLFAIFFALTVIFLLIFIILASDLLIPCFLDRFQTLLQQLVGLIFEGLFATLHEHGLDIQKADVHEEIRLLASLSSLSLIRLPQQFFGIDLARLQLS